MDQSHIEQNVESTLKLINCSGFLEWHCFGCNSSMRDIHYLVFVRVSSTVSAQLVLTSTNTNILYHQCHCPVLFIIHLSLRKGCTINITRYNNKMLQKALSYNPYIIAVSVSKNSSTYIWSSRVSFETMFFALIPLWVWNTQTKSRKMRKTSSRRTIGQSTISLKSWLRKVWLQL